MYVTGWILSHSILPGLRTLSFSHSVPLMDMPRDLCQIYLVGVSLSAENKRARKSNGAGVHISNDLQINFETAIRNMVKNCTLGGLKFCFSPFQPCGYSSLSKSMKTVVPNFGTMVRPRKCMQRDCGPSLSHLDVVASHTHIENGKSKEGSGVDRGS